jgi:hypothetical protein
MSTVPVRQSVAVAESEAAGEYTFVCYARKDLGFVLDLASRLRDRELRLWLDQWNIGAGEDWDQAIDAALKRCAGVLIVLSPDAVRSDEVRGELRSALNDHKHIVPVLYRPCDIPRQLQTTQYLDVTDGEMTDTLVDDLAAALRRQPGPRGERWRKPWQPLSYVSGRLKAIGASAAGALVLLAASGLLAEASYARLLKIPLSLSVAGVLASGLQFFLTLLTETLVLTLPAGLLLLLVAAVGRVGRKLLPRLADAASDRLRRALGRPRLLLSAELALYGLLFFVSLPAFADALPLGDMAFSRGLFGARPDALGQGPSHYRTAVLHVATASLLLAGLEAWRRRVHQQWKRTSASNALLSTALAVPLYLLVAAELVLLPIGHGLLKLPSRREYSAAVVTFTTGVKIAELKGKSLLLVELESSPSYRLYCPQVWDGPQGREGPQVWDVDERDIGSVAARRTGTLVQLLEAFRPLQECEVPGRPPEGGAR